MGVAENESARARPAPRERTIVRRRAARWGLAAVIVGSALALGTVHTITLCVIALLLAAVVALQFWDTDPVPVRRPAKVVAAVAIALVGWTFLQQVPLPAGWLATIAPANADVWARALSPLKEAGPAWAPISLDPIATRIQVLRGLVYVMVFLCALRIASRTEGVKFIERSLLVSAVAMGVAAVVHPLLGIERVFGVFEPETAEFGTRIAPLLNSNHLSAYLNLGSCVALGWALARRSRTHRAIPVAIYLVLVAVQIFVASRAGVASMLLGSALVLWLVHRGDRESRAVPWRFVAPGAFAVVLVTASVFLLRRSAVDDLTSSDTFKVELIRRATEMLPPFGGVGIGRGAFESVFPAFRADGEGHVVFTHPENLVVQWTVEWGVPVGLAALLLLAVSLRPATALARSFVPAGPAAGLMAVVVHNLLDFSSEVPAVVIGLAVCAACVTGGAASTKSAEAPAWWMRRPRAFVVAAAVITLVASAGAMRGRGRELADDQEALRLLALAPDASRETFTGAARAAMLRHPAEPYLPLMGGARAMRQRDENPIPWLARSLERAKVYGRAHLLLARFLGRRSPAQARLEYRLAMEQDFGLVGTATREAAELVQRPEDVLQLVPEGRAAEHALIALEKLLRSRAPAAANSALNELATRNPRSLVVARTRTEIALQELRKPSPACESDRPRCVQAALEAAEQLRAATPNECEGHRLMAEVRAETGEPEVAYIELERSIDGLKDRASCYRLLIRLAQTVGDERSVRLAVERMVASGCSSDHECVQLYLDAARAEDSGGSKRKALAYAKKAHARAPQAHQPLVAIGRLAEALGAHDEAVRAYERLTELDPGNRAWRDAVNRARAARSSARTRALGFGAPDAGD